MEHEILKVQVSGAVFNYSFGTHSATVGNGKPPPPEELIYSI